MTGKLPYIEACLQKIQLGICRKRQQNAIPLLVILSPEIGFNSQLTLAPNQNKQIVTKEFAIRLIDHRRCNPAPYIIAQFCLNHAKHRLDLRPLVIMLQELLSTQMIKMERLVP